MKEYAIHSKKKGREKLFHWLYQTFPMLLFKWLQFVIKNRKKKIGLKIEKHQYLGISIT